MGISLKKTIKTSLFLVEFISICLLSTGCGPQLFVKHVNTNNAKLRISKTEKTSGDVIIPRDVILTNTIPEMVKKHTSQYTFLYQSSDVIDVLVLPIHFKNNCNVLFEDEVKANINATLNGSSIKKVYPTSVKDFYSKSSFGAINLNFVVADWYTFSSSKLIKNHSDVDKLIDSASKSAKVKGENLDLKRFDKNNDGYIDAVWAIYDMPNYTNNPSEKDNDLFWAYTVSKDNSRNTNKIPVSWNYSFASYDFMDGYSDALNARTYIHETGHLFGLSDYYDYGNDYYPTAGFDMMDLNVFDHNSYSKMTLGWMKPYIVYGDAIINEEELKKSNGCIVILEDEKELNYDSSHKYVFNPFKEYILLDYFDATSSSLNYFDLTHETEQKNMPKISIDESGYRLYHVDGRFLTLSNEKNKIVGEFYNSNIPITSDKIGAKVITNSSSKAENNETFYLESYEQENLIEENIDYYNEITLIAKNSENLNHTYKNLYYSYSDDNLLEKTRTPLTNDLLFRSGDKFEVNSTFNKYFVKGGNENYFKFNDEAEKYSTLIIFE